MTNKKTKSPEWNFKINFDNLYKLYFSNLAFILLLILVIIVSFNVAIPNEEQFNENLEKVTDLTTVNENEFDAAVKYFENILIIMAVMGIILILFIALAWSIFNIIDNNILKQNNLGQMKIGEIFFQLGNNIVFLLMTALFLLILSLLSSFSLLLQNPVAVIIYFLIVLTGMTYLIQWHYLFSFNSSIKDTVIKLLKSHYTTWRNNLTIIFAVVCFVLAFILFGYLFREYPQIRLDYLFIVTMIPIFISYIKCFIFEHVNK